jgi:hypothetical protein
MSDPTLPAADSMPFAATAKEGKSLRVESLAKFGFLAITLLLLIPAAGSVGSLMPLASGRARSSRRSG